MKDFDPAMLRRLAARYRERAETEPDMADTFRKIAADMEAHARRTERG
ncbi:MAG TPA: hypothetical protein VFS49_09980 [Croceibacterium sp.]|nr:hypothetical protein [Croceibacterium sp.]